ncbi:MAG: hypothetical protein ACREMY_18200, partial [bacterium]
ARSGRHSGDRDAAKMEPLRAVTAGPTQAVTATTAWVTINVRQVAPSKHAASGDSYNAPSMLRFRRSKRWWASLRTLRTAC